MKKNILFYLLLLASSSLFAQASYIREDFNTICISSGLIPMPWFAYNPVGGTDPDGKWSCAPAEGRASTNGVSCTGYFDGSFHLDTSYLITGRLNFSSIHNPIKLRFDSKTTRITMGGRLYVYTTTDSMLWSGSARLTDISMGMMPVISTADSADWVTHTIDMSNYKDSSDFYLAFMYTSPVTWGSIWYLDNINTDTSVVTGLNTIYSNPSATSITLQANYTACQINATYFTPNAGNYNIGLTDLTGRLLHTDVVMTTEGKGRLTINATNLKAGMYLLRMYNESGNAVTKIVVQ